MDSSNNSNLHTKQLTEIILQAQAGKQEALSDLYETYFVKIYNFTFYRVSHKETAEDITEDVFIKVFENIGNLTNIPAFEGWLYQIARNLIIDYYRKKKPQVQIETLENTLEYDSNIADIVNLQIEQSILLNLLKELNDEQQSVIKLKFIEDLDNTTIANLLNKTEGAIRVIQHRALTRLKELFTNYLNRQNKPTNTHN